MRLLQKNSDELTLIADLLRPREALDDLELVGSYVFEKDSVALSLLPIARFAAKVSLEIQPALLYVESTRVWASQNDDFIVSIFARNVLNIADGCVKDNSYFSVEFINQEALTTFLFFSMLFGWDVSISSLSPIAHIEINNDGQIRLFSRSNGASEVAERFKSETGRNLHH